MRRDRARRPAEKGHDLRAAAAAGVERGGLRVRRQLPLRRGKNGAPVGEGRVIGVHPGEALAWGATTIATGRSGIAGQGPLASLRHVPRYRTRRTRQWRGWASRALPAAVRRLDEGGEPGRRSRVEAWAGRGLPRTLPQVLESTRGTQLIAQRASALQQRDDPLTTGRTIGFHGRGWVHVSLRSQGVDGVQASRPSRR